MEPFAVISAISGLQTFEDSGEVACRSSTITKLDGARRSAPREIDYYEYQIGLQLTGLAAYLNGCKLIPKPTDTLDSCGSMQTA